MSVELLVGVLLLSMAADAALILRLSRSDQVKVLWPRLFAGFESNRARPPAADLPAPRRRALFVAGGPNCFKPETAGSVATPAFVSLPTAQTPLSKTLPPDLADFLSRPAPIVRGAEGAAVLSFPSKDGGSGLGPAPQDGEVGVMARLPVQPGGVSTGSSLDSLTGLEGPASWSRIIEIENARLLRYRRPVTVAAVEVEGLRRLADRLGDDPVDRLLPVIADVLRREARAADWVARIGDGRFAVLLPETDEIQAINYVERIRLVCEPWLASAAVPLWLAIGWSGPTAASDLEFALLRAEERMHADRRVAGRSIQLPRVVPGRGVSLSRNGPSSAAPPEANETRVPPAETGRSGEGIDSGTRPEGQFARQAAEVPRGNGYREAPQAAAAPDRRTEV